MTPLNKQNIQDVHYTVNVKDKAIGSILVTNDNKFVAVNSGVVTDCFDDAVDSLVGKHLEQKQ